MTEQFQAGDYIVNPKKTEWGPGIVLSTSGAILTIFFRDVSMKPVKDIHTEHVTLESAGIDEDPILDNLPRYDPANRKFKEKRVTHKDGVELFQSYFPLLFDDPKYIGTRTTGERTYKLEAHNLYQDQLGNGVGESLLDKGEIPELNTRLFHVEGLLNLLSPYEKMALHDALRDEQAAQRFYSALFSVIESDQVDRDSFQLMIDAVNQLPREPGKARVATWPILTQFPFIARPDHHMFLKPDVTRSCADRMSFDLMYKSSLNCTTYAQLIKFADLLFDELKPMGAKDFIDVQSYIWVIGAY